MTSRYADLVHEFVDPRTNETRYCVGHWESDTGQLYRPLDATERRANPGGAYGMQARKSPAGMAWLGSFPTSQQAIRRARTLFGEALEPEFDAEAGRDRDY